MGSILCDVPFRSVSKILLLSTAGDYLFLFFGYIRFYFCSIVASARLSVSFPALLCFVISGFTFWFSERSDLVLFIWVSQKSILS